MSSKKRKSAALPAMEDLLGPKLLTEAGKPPVPTSDALKGAELVGLYFSASWCPPCKSFTPLLVDFYNSSGKAGGLRIVFVSSDRDAASFEEYYKTMPWAALPLGGTMTPSVKRIGQSIGGIPTLVIMDVKTGGYVTDGGRNDVVERGGSHGKELVEEWKGGEAVPLDRAAFGHGQPGMLARMFTFFLSRPLYIVGTLYFLKQFLNYLKKLGAEEEEEEESPFPIEAEDVKSAQEEF